MFAIPAAATQKKAAAPHTKSLERAPAPRLKFVIRRLPPGLSVSEFESALGEEWREGGPRVDWAVFKPGKVIKE